MPDVHIDSNYWWWQWEGGEEHRRREDPLAMCQAAGRPACPERGGGNGEEGSKGGVETRTVCLMPGMGWGDAAHKSLLVWQLQDCPFEQDGKPGPVVALLKIDLPDIRARYGYKSVGTPLGRKLMEGLVIDSKCHRRGWKAQSQGCKRVWGQCVVGRMVHRRYSPEGQYDP